MSAFTITMYEYAATIPSLWNHVMGSFLFPKSWTKYVDFSFHSKKDFAHAHPEYIAKDNSLGFMSSDNGKTYNLCHCQYHSCPSMPFILFNTLFQSSLEQFWNSRYGILAWSCIYGFLWISRLTRRLLLRGMYGLFFLCHIPYENNLSMISVGATRLSTL